MTSMDFEGIAALAAAVMAGVAIPASMLVGRWQMKAALRTAEATSEAGLAQADSAYRAALDAVRAEANAAHLQWRRGIQRDAYASFLLAANRVQELGERFVRDNESDLTPETIRAGKDGLDDALVSLKAAQTVIELEGPDDVAAPAAGMTDAAHMIGYHLGKQATYERAWGRLGRMLDESPDVSAAAGRLMEALAGLRSNGSSEQDQPAGRSTGSCSDARRALPPGALDDDEFRALLEGWTSRPPALSSSYLDAVQRFREKEECFVRAAKIELHALPGL
ncbi:hypothetical protein ACFCX3_14370 [Streptomyces virginiae]|uniref:hypothetical protein n=1 Tax=Streptomyces virginiae TaxID=1961 RepID=UPI0035E1DA6E